VNNRDIYLEGGNWITTDIFLRYANDKQRYYDEVKFHKSMGMNLIRVWGGGITERRSFYEACDKYGVFVYQEFWMTGDNNGKSK
jgi:mannosylglycoprotein endo-beta-mannosidase